LCGLSKGKALIQSRLGVVAVAPGDHLPVSDAAERKNV